MKYILSAVIAAIVLIGGIYTGERMVPQTPTASFGAFTPVQASTFTLAGAGITNSQNTIQLASFALPDPNKTPINMSMFGSIGYAVIEPQTSRIENVSFTGVTQNANGSATLTGVTRGISFYSPFVSSTTLMLSHAGGSNFILSNPGVFYSQFAFPNNSQTWTATQTFGSTTPPTYDADPIWANFSTQVFADVSYVNSVVAAGAANASETVKGIVQLATAAQAALGTSVGSTGARLALGNNLATSTPGNSTVTGDIPVLTGSTLNANFINQAAVYAWSALHTFSAGFIDTASSTFVATTSQPCTNVLSNACRFNSVPYQFPSSQGAGGSILSNNGSGILSWGSIVKYSIVNNSATTATSATYATSSTILSIPAGILSASSTITVDANIQCTTGGNNCSFYLSDSGGIPLASCGGTANTSTGSLHFFVANQSSLSSQAYESTCILPVTSALSLGTAGSSSFNTANTLNLVMVVKNGNAPSGSVSITNYSIEVTP